MIPIGPFSELTGLSVKTLRHYHEQELLVPERVDEHSQERAYSPWQILRAARISALRRSGMPLTRVRQLIDGPQDPAAALQAYGAELREKREQEDAALAEAAVVLAASPEAEVHTEGDGIPRAVTVRLPTTGPLGMLTLAVAHLVAHEVPGYFVAVGELSERQRGDETEYTAPLRPMPADADE